MARFGAASVAWSLSALAADGDLRAQIFMGGRQTIVMHNTCEDSLLAAPIILDLVILAELLQRIQARLITAIGPNLASCSEGCISCHCELLPCTQVLHVHGGASRRAGITPYPATGSESRVPCHCGPRCCRAHAAWRPGRLELKGLGALMVQQQRIQVSCAL